MILKSLGKLKKADIDTLINNHVRESRQIDYKRELPGGKDSDTREFLADVSSFANASGGDLVFGVSEEEGIPKEAIGLAEIDVEAEILRLESTIRDGIDPRIIVETQGIEGFDKGPVLVLRVPKSWTSPHMVKFGNWSRFFVRGSAGKHQLDVAEIRSAFTLSEALPERIKTFRTDRLMKILSDDTPVRLTSGPRIVLHVCPLLSFSSRLQIDPKAICSREEGLLRPLRGNANGNRFNVDGFVTYSNGTPHCYDYCQMFRNGVVEAVDSAIIREDETFIAVKDLEKYIIASTQGYINLLKVLEISPPVIVMLSILNADGYEIPCPRATSSLESTPIDRPVLLLPDVLIENYDVNVGQELRPIFDAFWNAGGYPGSTSYDDEGDRIG